MLNIDIFLQCRRYRGANNLYVWVNAVDFNGRTMPVITNPVFETVAQPQNPYVEEFYIKVE
jgi:hypothetical protein